MFSRALIALSVLGVPAALTACSSSDGANESASTGTLTLPLVTHVGDNTYRLQAYIDIRGPISTWLYPDGSDQTVLTVDLPTGNYNAYMYGWQLERLDENGNFVPVQANLVSSHWVDFTIYNRASTTISFQFETPSESVVVGSGKLNITFGVTETPPACAALGSDCGEGFWCPPNQLTGAPAACVPEGAIAIGQACASPLDCVANSTCIELGAGSVCAALCLAADFGAPCASGGTCTEVTRQYGVCVPPGGTLPPDGAGGAPNGGSGEGGAGGAGN